MCAFNVGTEVRRWPIDEINKSKINKRADVSFGSTRALVLRQVPLAGLNTGLDRLLREGIERHAGVG
jgi:hypothetical protein